MKRFLLTVLAVFFGNTLFFAVGYSVYKTDYAQELDAKLTRLISNSEEDDDTIRWTKGPDMEGKNYMARVPIPGYPLEECMGAKKVLNNKVRKCSDMDVLTVYSPDPIPNNVEHARRFLADICIGKKSEPLTPRQSAKWCDFYNRIQLYGHKIKVQSGWKIAKSH